MRISKKQWDAYVSTLRHLCDSAADLVEAYYNTHDVSTQYGWNQFVDYVCYVIDRYGLAASEAACEMYEYIAIKSGRIVEYAENAPLPKRTSVNSALRQAVQTRNGKVVGRVADMMVKSASINTTIFNAGRDHAEFAWVPTGASCAFCITLASRGWQSTKNFKNKQDNHIHPNCDCTYAVRFDEETNVEGYEPEEYLAMYESGDPDGDSQDKINGLRRRLYAENRSEIRAQQREAYRLRKEREK